MSCSFKLAIIFTLVILGIAYVTADLSADFATDRRLASLKGIHRAHSTRVVNDAHRTRRVVTSNTPIDNIREYASSMMNCPSVSSPGYAIVGVQGTNTLFADSVGIADLQFNTSAGPDTLWAIGSVTKSLTAVLLGKLVDDGLLQWNTEVREILPHFRLKDSSSSSVTVRDLMSMQAGVTRNDIVWAAGEASEASELIKNFRTLDISSPLRTTFHYNNFGYLFLGKIIETLTSQSWESNINQLFASLGMNSSVATAASAISSGRYAYPHLIDATTGLAVNYSPRNINVLSVDQIKPAGGVGLTVADASIYLKALLSPTFNGILSASTKSFLTEAGVMSLYNFENSGNTLLNFANDPADPVQLSLYAYGNSWLQGVYKGQAMYMGNGGTLGQSTWVVVFPSDQLAFMMVSNMGDVAGIGQYMWNWAVYARDQMVNDSSTINTNIVCSRVFAPSGFVDYSWRVGFTDNFTNAEIRQWKGTYNNAFWGDVIIREKPGNRIEAEYGLFKGDFLRDADGNVGWFTRPNYYQVVMFTPTFTIRGNKAFSMTIGANNPDPVFRRSGP